MLMQSLIPPNMTVSRTIRLFPFTVGVFNDFGIDPGRGGDLTIEAVARRDGADPIALVGALNRLAEEAL